jgi:phosphoglycolate phosphatase-like HAD superfamily hydrolase
MSSSLRLAWLFDIDGTLLVTDGAARESFAHAVRERLGVTDDLTDIAFAGRTEPLILADILQKHRAAFRDGEEAHFWNAVFDHMRRIFHDGRGRLLPGVPELLGAVARETAWVAGILTGNMTEMARIKLSRFGLERHFRFGGFGEQAADRDQLARQTVERLRRQFRIPPERCIVVGDTAHDITCARAAGARVVAVATGPSTRAELEAFGPDLALEDLSDADRLLAWARAIQARPVQ